jgi:putative transposase
MPRKEPQRKADRVRDTTGGSRQESDDVCREMGVSAQAFYNWKRRYAGVGVTEIRELRQSRDENRQLKTLVADLRLDKHILQEVL